MSTTMKTKVGIPRCLCAAPFVSALANRDHSNLEFVENSPTILQEELLSGGLNVSFVSSLMLGRQPGRYKILPGLSITASGSGAVYLFSHVPLKQLQGGSVCLAADCDTSIELTKLVLEQFNNVTPDYIPHNEATGDPHQFDAVLVDGDNALRLLEKADHLYQFDLGDIWKRKTGLPLVLSVCLVREEYCNKEKENVLSVYKELLCCRNEGSADIEETCKIYAPTIPFTKQKCREYFDVIEFDLGRKKMESLEIFLKFMSDKGVLQSEIGELNIFSEIE